MQKISDRNVFFSELEILNFSRKTKLRQNSVIQNYFVDRRLKVAFDGNTS